MVEQVDRDEVRRLIAAGAQLVDVMPAPDYDEAHIEGAVNIPLRNLNATTAASLECAPGVIVYCHDFQ